MCSVYGETTWNYYRYNTTGTIDANQGIPIVTATDRPIYITQLSIFSITNTANATMAYAIVPSGAERIGGTPHYQVDQLDIFSIGLTQGSVGPTSQTLPVGVVGMPTKGSFSYVVVPPGGILVAYPDIALNGTIGHTATGYCYA